MILEPLDLAVGDWDSRVEGYYVKETDTHLVHILPMIFNHRIVYTPKSFFLCWDDAWCYDDYAEALIAAIMWDPETQKEPTGWKKHPLTGRRGGEDARRDEEREELEVQRQQGPA